MMSNSGKPAATLLVYIADDPSVYGNPEYDLDLATAPDYQVIFSCFMGNVDLVIDGMSFRTDSGRVSTLGFAVGMLNSIQELRQRGEVRAGFLESDDWIDFLLLYDSLVRVSCSYSPVVATIVYDELLRLAQKALEDLLRGLSSKFPALKRNSWLAGALNELDFPASYGD